MLCFHCLVMLICHIEMKMNWRAISKHACNNIWEWGTVVAKNIGTLALFSNNSQFSRKISWNWQKYLVSTIPYFTVNMMEPLCLNYNLIYPFKSENKRNGIDKIIDTLDLIFGSTTFGQNNCSQVPPIAMDELPTPLYWKFGQTLFFCKLLQFSQIWRVPSPNCCFQISPQVFNGI